MTRICAAATMAATLAPACLHAAEMHAVPMQTLSSSGMERTLDWRGWRAKASFDVPPTATPESLRIVLDAMPGDVAPAPHAWIEVRLNGSQPAILRPEPYPFAAQVDFPAQYLRTGRNEATIEYVSPAGVCPGEADGAWVLNLRDSQFELTAQSNAPRSLDELDALLRSDFLSPQRIAITADGLDDDARAAFQAWAAMAIGARAPRTPIFVTDGAASDLTIAFILDPEAEHAFFSFEDGRVQVHGALPEAAVALLQDWAQAAPPAPFAVPAFDETWSPEPETATFRLERRPLGAALRVRLAAQPDGASMQLLLNGRPFGALRAGGRRTVSVALPPHLLRPGFNTIGFAPQSAPAAAPETCPRPGDDPHLRIESMRIAQQDSAGGPDMFGFAAAAFAAPAHLVLPASDEAQRTAQLRLLAEIARRGGAVPSIAGVSATAALADGPNIVIAPRAVMPPGVLEFAPDSLRALLRGERAGGDFRLGAQAIAAPLTVPDIAGAAAHFIAPGAGDLFLVTEAAGADFAATLDRLVDSGMLAGFDGQVVGWWRSSVQVQDHGPWRPLPLRAVAPPGRDEAVRTILLLAILAGLSLAWLVAPRRRVS